MNLDNSLSVRLAHHQLVLRLLRRLGAIHEGQLAFATKARVDGIRWAEASRLPIGNESADVVYSCHMVEHLNSDAARGFLAETFRVLRPGGVLRLVIPDLRLFAEEYLQDGDADRFVRRTLLADDHLNDFSDRLRTLIAGPRNHLWMYDASSISRLLEDAGYTGIRELAPGETTIQDPGQLDLFERCQESFIVEARKPITTNRS
jgi:predicted SAM-dependent methyltransferase